MRAALPAGVTRPTRGRSRRRAPAPDEALGPAQGVQAHAGQGVAAQLGGGALVPAGAGASRDRVEGGVQEEDGSRN